MIFFLNRGRKVFILIDVGGNLGGLVQMFSFLIRFLVEPITVHAFTLKAISSFYLMKKNSN